MDTGGGGGGRYSYTNTVTPTWTLPAARTKLHTTGFIGWEPQNDGSKKGPKLQKHGVAVFGHKTTMVITLNHSGNPTVRHVSRGGARSPCLAQSSFKLQQFLCSKGYAMDNLDEPQGIHLSLKLHPYLQSNSSVRACRIDDFCSAGSACMQHTVCPTIHCYCNQALLRLSVAVVVLCCSPLCVNVFDCCCCVAVFGPGGGGIIGASGSTVRSCTGVRVQDQSAVRKDNANNGRTPLPH